MVKEATILEGGVCVCGLKAGVNMKFGQKRRIFFLGAICNFVIEDPLHRCKGLVERKLYEMQRVSPMNMEPSKLPWLK